VIRAADDAVLNFADGFGEQRRRAALRTHLNELAVLALSLDEHNAFSRIMAARLFDVDVFAGLQGVDGHRRVPMVGRSDSDRVDFFDCENVAEVFVSRRHCAALFLHGGGELIHDVGLDITDVRDVGVLLVCFQSGQVRVRTAVESDDGEVQPIV
jgi:hypothetical protein